MKLNNFKTVLKKELKDLFRDKKSIISTILIPVIIYPLMMYFIGGGISNLVDSKDDINIAVTGEFKEGEYITLENEDKQIIETIISDFNSVSDKKINIIDKNADLNKALVVGDISTIVTVQAGIRDIKNLSNNKTAYTVGYVVDNRSNSSVIAASTVEGLINSYAEGIYQTRLNQVIGDGTSVTDYIAIKGAVIKSVDDVYTRSGTGNQMLLMIIPMLVTILISVGGATIAVDLIAGEKERGTFEPLLSTSASRFSVLSAKYLVVIIFSFINGIVQVLAMGMGIAISPGMSQSMGGGGGALSLSFGGLALGIINILLLAAFFCSVMLCLASTAKTFKEASTKTSFLVFLPIILSYSVMFTDAVNINLTNMFIPIINVVSVIKMILSGYINYMYFLVSAGVNLAFLAAAIYITLKTFSKESLITRG